MNKREGHFVKGDKNQSRAIVTFKVTVEYPSGEVLKVRLEMNKIKFKTVD